jgi:hypothetical protein
MIDMKKKVERKERSLPARKKREEENRGAFWDMSGEELLEDFDLATDACAEMTPDEYLEEFEHLEGNLNPESKKKFLELVQKRGEQNEQNR